VWFPEKQYASTQPYDQTVKKHIGESDLFLCIVGYEYGSVHSHIEDKPVSHVQSEYYFCQDLQKKEALSAPGRLILLRNAFLDPAKLPSQKLCDEQRRFVEDIRRDENFYQFTTGYFKPEELVLQAKDSVWEWEMEKDRHFREKHLPGGSRFMRLMNSFARSALVISMAFWMATLIVVASMIMLLTDSSASPRPDETMKYMGLLGSTTFGGLASLCLHTVIGRLQR
jgi:hypothetical protein